MLTVTREGSEPVEVPREVVAKGTGAVAAYVEKAWGQSKPLSKMSRAELDERADELGLDPEEYSNMGELREAIEAAEQED